MINHGVAGNLMEETMSLMKEFFSLPAEYKARFYSTDINSNCRIYSSSLHYEKEDFHYWRDNFTHRCHPLEDYIQNWPDKPSKYRYIDLKYPSFWYSNKRNPYMNILFFQGRCWNLLCTSEEVCDDNIGFNWRRIGIGKRVF